MRKLFSLIILFCSTGVMSQDIGIGQWRSHLSHQQARLLERVNSTIFCATENGLFSVNVDDNSITKFTREGGLGSAGISAIHFAEEAQILILGYHDGIIDIINSNGEIISIKTLRDAAIVADKAINDIASLDQTAYLATDFGIVVLDLLNLAVKENFRNIGLNAEEIAVRDILVTSDSLFLSTNLGLQSVSFQISVSFLKAYTPSDHPTN